VRVRQRVYFGLFSHYTTAAQMTARLGIEPDRFSVQGARSPRMDIPRGHSWEVECREPGLTIDEQIAKVLSRISPQEHKIAELARDLEKEDPSGGAVLRVVRFFNDDEGEEEEVPETILLDDGRELEKLSGQHQLLGWHLDKEVMTFLRAVGADLDVDEYG
jgi:hypothetical protein